MIDNDNDNDFDLTMIDNDLLLLGSIDPLRGMRATLKYKNIKITKY